MFLENNVVFLENNIVFLENNIVFLENNSERVWHEVIRYGYVHYAAAR